MSWIWRRENWFRNLEISLWFTLIPEVIWVISMLIAMKFHGLPWQFALYGKKNRGDFSSNQKTLFPFNISSHSCKVAPTLLLISSIWRCEYAGALCALGSESCDYNRCQWLLQTSFVWRIMGDYTRIHWTYYSKMKMWKNIGLFNLHCPVSHLVHCKMQRFQITCCSVDLADAERRLSQGLADEQTKKCRSWELCFIIQWKQTPDWLITFEII